MRKLELLNEFRKQNGPDWIFLEHTSLFNLIVLEFTARDLFPSFVPAIGTFEYL